MNIINVNGYEGCYDPKNSNADKSGIVYLHRHLMSRSLGRTLTREEHVHHINGDRMDNRIENLLLVSASEHLALHRPARAPVFRSCVECGTRTVNKRYCSDPCARLGSRKIKERPSREVLLEELKTLSYCAMGRKYGVSDNAIRKWLR